MAILDPIERVLTHPGALALVVVVPLMAVLSLIALRRGRRIIGSWGEANGRIPSGSRRISRFWVRGFTRLTLVALLIVGIAGPRWGQETTNPAPGRDVVVLLDLSRSMLAQDVMGESLPSRLGRGKDALFDLAASLQRRGGHRLALVAFAARSRLICPLTNDYEHFREAVSSLEAGDPSIDSGPSPSGTRMGDGIRTAVQAQDPRFPGCQDVLMISDGDDPLGDEEWSIGVEAARARGVRVHTVGVGNPDRTSAVPLPGGGVLEHDGKPVQTRLVEFPLKEIARLTGGVYIPARTKTVPLGELFREAIDPLPRHEQLNDLVAAYKPRYAWFFAAALLCFLADFWLAPRAGKPANQEGAAAAFLVGILPILLAAAIPESARRAESWVTRGNEAFEAGDYQEALARYKNAEERTTDPGLVAFNEAATFYRLGEFKEAELHYLRAREDATGDRLARLLFDLGNTLVREGQDSALLRRAIASYEDCLRQPAASAELRRDARYNLEFARALLSQERQRQTDDGGTGEKPPPPEEPESRTAEDGARHGAGSDAGRVEAGQNSVDNGEPAAESANRSPGMGNLPPIPDSERLSPMSPEETSAYLRAAVDRIRRERTENRRPLAKSTGIPLDW